MEYTSASKNPFSVLKNSPNSSPVLNPFFNKEVENKVPIFSLLQDNPFYIKEEKKENNLNVKKEIKIES